MPQAQNKLTSGRWEFFSVDDVLPGSDCMVLATELCSRAANGCGVYSQWETVWYASGQFWHLDDNCEPDWVLPGIAYWMYVPPLPADYLEAGEQ